MVTIPSAPVWRETETLVPSLVTVTVAPGIKAPLGSATVPVNVPVETCPRANGSAQHTSASVIKGSSQQTLDFDLNITTPLNSSRVLVNGSDKIILWTDERSRNLQGLSSKKGAKLRSTLCLYVVKNTLHNFAY